MKRKISIPIGNYLLMAIIIYSIYVLLPITRVLPSFIKAGIIIEVLILCFLGILQRSGNRTNNKVEYFTIMAISVLVLNALIYVGEYQYVGSYSFFAKFLVMFSFWIPFFIVIGYSDHISEYEQGRIHKIVFTLLIITTITTLFGLYLFDDASRALASDNYTENRLFQMYNIGGYGFIYSLVLALPWTIYSYKKSKRKRFIVAVILFMLCIIKSSYTTAIILGVYSIGMCILVMHSEGKNFKYKFGISVFLLAVVFYFIVNSTIFWNIASNSVVGNDILFERVSNLRNMALMGELQGDARYRANLYERSWNAFLMNPVSGNVLSTPQSLGYHSEVLDLLGGTGIVGCLLLIFIMFLVYKVTASKLKHSDIKHYYYVSITVFFFLSSMNTVLQSLELSLILGFLYFGTRNDITNRHLK